MSGVIETENPSDVRILDNVIGSGSLIELSLELRWTFSRPRGMTGLAASFIERSGITFFTDVGNAYNRLTKDLYGKANLGDYFKGAAVAMGLGYRFNTPVGPFRFDVATSVYDPMRGSGQVIWNGRRDVFGTDNLQISVGLGHAF